MNKIYKNISLEDSKSRLPGVVSSMVDGEFKKIDDNYLNFNYNGNYGLFVSDIKIPDIFLSLISDNTDILINIPITNVLERDVLKDEFYLIHPFYNKKDNDKYDAMGVAYYYIKNNNIYKNNILEKYLTYYSLAKWYHFFVLYEETICTDTCDGKRKYNSAIDYYNNEIEYTSDSLYEYYESLDKLYKSRGGGDFYKWICQNCIIKYEIPLEYQDSWNRSYLYYPEIIQWKSWFSIRHEKYKNLTFETCDSTSDCKEYFRRGGEIMYNNLKNINFIHNANETNSSSITVPINIVTSIDDMGEMSIFSKEWVKGEDYSNDSDSFDVNLWNIKNINGGALVIHNKDVLMLKNNSLYSGFTYDNTFKEIIFADEQWESYYNIYTDKHKEEFTPNFTTFTYNRKGKFFPNPTVDDLMEKYNITLESIYVIDKVICKAFKSDYIRYNNLYYIVHRYENGVPYTMINSKRHVAIFVDGEYKFFLNYKVCGKNTNPINIEKDGEFIFYSGGYYKINNNIVVINNTTYPKLNGYINIDGLDYYVNNNTLVRLYSANGDNKTKQNFVMQYKEDETFGKKINGTITNTTKGYVIDNNILKIYFPYEIYVANEITGQTTTKLDLFKEFKKGYDDMGNLLPGFFEISQKKDGTKYAQPQENDDLDLSYKIGSVCDLNKLYDRDGEIIDGEFFGNILTSIQFYYCYYDGNIVTQTLVKSSEYDGNNLEAIKVCKDKKKVFLETQDVLVLNDLYCEIEYYIGCYITQIKTGDENSGYVYKGYEYKNDGIKYVDTVILNQKQCDYYLSSTNNYPLNYYNMEYPLTTTILNEYDNTTIVNKLCKFYCTTNINDNGFIASPNVRLEYKFGTSSLQKIDSNVYVDRGISNAFDKHLKLGEVGSFEALSQYSNGQFNIINNN